MHNIVLALAMLTLTTITGNGQCNRKINWHATRIELLDENGRVVETRKADIIVSTDKSTISLLVKDSPNGNAEGDIIDTNCDWREAFKNGKTVYTADMHNLGSDSKTPCTFTVEARNGKVTIFMDMDKQQGKRARIPIEKYEEADNDLPVPRSIIDISTI